MNNAKIENQFAYFRGLPEELTKIWTSHVEADLKIRQKERLSSDMTRQDILDAERDKQKELNALKEKTLGKISAIRGQLDSREIVVSGELDKELGVTVPGADATANLLQETREGKAWTRIKPILDKHKDSTALVNEIKSLVLHFVSAAVDSKNNDSSDYDSIGAMRKELPFYYKSRFSGKEAETFLNEAIDVLESAMADMRPEFREAVNLRKELRTGLSQMNTALNYIQYAVEHNEPPVIIPAWEKGKTAEIK